MLQTLQALQHTGLRHSWTLRPEKPSSIAHTASDITQPHVNIAYVQRPPPQWVTKLQPGRCQPCRRHAILSGSGADRKLLLQQLQALLAEGAMGDAAECLVQDAAGLARDFAGLAGCSEVQATLAVVATATCSRWHADHVRLRALCTYIGPGTLFTPDSNADRRLWMRALGLQDTGGFHLRDAALVGQAGPSDVLWLKGDAWEGMQGKGAVHKSPELATGQRRLVLILDEVFDVRHQRHDHCSGSASPL